MRQFLRFDPKTGKKIGESMPKRRVPAAWWGYPPGYMPSGAPSCLRGSGPWAVHALGKGQKPTDHFGNGNPRSGELMYFRKG